MPLRSLLFLLALLSSSQGAAAKIKVVATTASLASLAHDVGGPDVDVVPLLEPHEDAHTAQARPSMVAALEQAELLLEVGMGLEAAWLPALKAQSKNPRLAPGGGGALDAATLIDRLEVPAAGAVAAAGNHGAGNPHYLIDPARAAKVAIGIGERLAALQPATAAKVRERARFLAGKLEDKAHFSRVELARKVPAERRRVAVYHASLAYLAGTIGVEQVAIVEEKPGLAFDAARLAELVERIRKSGAVVLVVDESVPRKRAREIAKACGVRLAVLPGGPRISLGDTFLTHIDRSVSAVFAGVAP